MTGNLSNDDGDGNENGKKAIGLDFQNKYFARDDFARASRAYFQVLWRTWTQDNDNLFLFLNFNTVL